MANAAFSPKDFKAWIIEEATTGTIPTITSGLLQLDVDSVSMPSLNINQNLTPSTSVGRVLHNEDFFQDNNLRIVEISLSGRWHDDTGHGGLLNNITGDTSGDHSIATGYAPDAIKYGDSKTAGHFDTFTLVLKAPSQSNAKNIEMAGCVVTNFTWSSDINTEGGMYKWSATIQTGAVCDFADATASSGTAYVNTDLFKLSSATATEVINAAVALNSFTLTIDNPAVFVGSKLDAAGYEVVNRGAECSVTLDCQVKYDDATDEFINLFDAQTAAYTTTYPFKITASNAGGIQIDNAVFTNISLSEGEIMMLDISMKSVDDGSDALLTLDE